MLRPAPGASPSGGARTRLPSLTSLRFFAALFVFLYHFSMENGPLAPYGPLNPFADRRVAADYTSAVQAGGYVGVSFFFVLSGFVLTWSSSLDERKTAFWRRRVLKIFPNHVTLWIIAMALFAAAADPWKAWLPNLFLINSYFPQSSIFATVNMPSWTLCSEMLFYMLFPLLLRPIWKIKARRLWYWVGGGVACMVGIQLINVFLIPDSPISPYLPGTSIPQQWFGYIFPPTRLFEFILGMLLCRIVRAGKFPRITVAPALVLMLGGLWLESAVPVAFSFEVATIVPVIVLIGAAATGDIEARGRVLSNRVMVWLGEISFAFYICQGVVLFYGRIRFTHNAQYGTLEAVGVQLAFFAANLLAASLLYSFVEKPIMRRWARSRKRPPTSRSGASDGIPIGVAGAQSGRKPAVALPGAVVSAEATAPPAPA